MKKIILEKNSNGIFVQTKLFKEEKTIDYKFDIIEDLLFSNYIEIDFLNKLLEDESETWLGTNEGFIEKDGDMLVIGYEQDYEEKKYVFRTKPKYLVDMIERWEEIFKINPNKISILLYKDGKVKINPVD
ncbi:hypothetical protein HN446_01670 [bacterium]|jgi:hypothetical protein|nr:hypothetical protein [bacterium]